MAPTSTSSTIPSSSSLSSSSWAKKLEKRLDGLADGGASRESIQTIANWIAFHRRQAPSVAAVLTRRLLDAKTDARRQWTYWQVLHEVLVTDHGTTATTTASGTAGATGTAAAMSNNAANAKWEKLADLRVALGEALVPTMEALGTNLPSHELMDPYIRQWADLNVFGGPSLLAQIKRLYHGRNQPSTATADSTTEEAGTFEAAPTTIPNEESPNDDDDNDEDDTKKSMAPSITATAERTLHSEPTDVTASKPIAETETTTTTTKTKIEDAENAPKPSEKRSSFSHLNQDVEYDFESKGVPPGKVESREFLDPCKAITSLQIARDVRANSAVEISMALSNLPEDILDVAEGVRSGTVAELDTAMVNDLSIRIPSNLLDLDIDEELASLRMFQDIVERQKLARERLIYLLLKSRCKFGSTEAARDYHQMSTVVMEKLKKRKQLLSDALELEGLDPTQIGDDDDGNGNDKGNDKGNTKGKKARTTTDEDDLPPLAWYQPEGDDHQIVAGAGSNKD